MLFRDPSLKRRWLLIEMTSQVVCTKTYNCCFQFYKTWCFNLNLNYLFKRSEKDLSIRTGCHWTGLCLTWYKIHTALLKCWFDTNTTNGFLSLHLKQMSYSESSPTEIEKRTNVDNIRRLLNHIIFTLLTRIDKTAEMHRYFGIDRYHCHTIKWNMKKDNAEYISRSYTFTVIIVIQMK